MINTRNYWEDFTKNKKSKNPTNSFKGHFMFPLLYLLLSCISTENLLIANTEKKNPAWLMEDCMSFAFSDCGSTLLHHFKETERKGGKKKHETLGHPGLVYHFFFFVLFFIFLFFLWRDVSSAGFLKSTLSADLISEMASGDPGQSWPS